MKQQDTVPKKHILVTGTPVTRYWLQKLHPLLVDEFPEGTLVCAKFPGDASEIVELSSDPTKVLVVDIDSLENEQVECLVSARQNTKGTFYVYSKARRSMELVIPGCKPGTSMATLPR